MAARAPAERPHRARRAHPGYAGGARNARDAGNAGGTGDALIPRQETRNRPSHAPPTRVDRPRGLPAPWPSWAPCCPRAPPPGRLPRSRRRRPGQAPPSPRCRPARRSRWRASPSTSTTTEDLTPFLQRRRPDSRPGLQQASKFSRPRSQTPDGVAEQIPRRRRAGERGVAASSSSELLNYARAQGAGHYLHARRALHRPASAGTSGRGENLAGELGHLVGELPAEPGLLPRHRRRGPRHQLRRRLRTAEHREGRQALGGAHRAHPRAVPQPAVLLHQLGPLHRPAVPGKTWISSASAGTGT